MWRHMMEQPFPMKAPTNLGPLHIPTSRFNQASRFLSITIWHCLLPLSCVILYESCYGFASHAGVFLWYVISNYWIAWWSLSYRSWNWLVYFSSLWHQVVVAIHRRDLSHLTLHIFPLEISQCKLVLAFTGSSSHAMSYKCNQDCLC